MNAIFSKTMDDTETNISHFILEDTENSKMVSNCQKTIWFIFYLQLKCYFTICSLKHFLKNFVISNFQQH